MTLTDEQKLRAQWLIAEINRCTAIIEINDRAYCAYPDDYRQHLEPLRAELEMLLGPLPAAHGPELPPGRWPRVEFKPLSPDAHAALSAFSKEFEERGHCWPRSSATRPGQSGPGQGQQ